MLKKTKIVATLGPASNDPETIKRMIQNGMDAARINFSHETYETHAVLIKALKKAREDLRKPIPLILDTKGPEIRIGNFSENRIYIDQGQDFTLTTREVIGDKSVVSVTYGNLPKDVSVGGRILIDDGLIELKIRGVTETDIMCVAVNSGFLSSRKGVNVPDVHINLPSITENDIKDIEFGVKMGFDYISASFVRSAEDVMKIRQVLEANRAEHIHIIAKIESRAGVDNLDAILGIADGIMVARGDLGVEIPPEEVPLAQKLLIRRSNLAGKPVITATHMLESMVKNPRPTRAEANDVANAIFDGTDAVMLSAETAVGAYPVESVGMMARISAKAEETIDYYTNLSDHYMAKKTNTTNAICFATCNTAADLKAACIVSITDSGFSARMVSRNRPACPIIAVTADESVCRQLNLIWGCEPAFAEKISGNDEVFDIAEEKAVESGLVKNGDIIVAVAGVPVGVAGTTNTLKVRIAGDVLAKGKGMGDRTVRGIAKVVRDAETEEHYFQRGDILVATSTSDGMMDFIRKAGAIVVGTWEEVDNSHAETVAKALNIPLIISNQRVVDQIRDGIAVTVDSKNGFVYNGYRKDI